MFYSSNSTFALVQLGRRASEVCDGVASEPNRRQQCDGGQLFRVDAARRSALRGEPKVLWLISAENPLGPSVLEVLFFAALVGGHQRHYRSNLSAFMTAFVTSPRELCWNTVSFVFLQQEQLQKNRYISRNISKYICF